MAKPLVLVDGAGGFLGGHLVQALLEEGYPVRATDLPTVSLEHLKRPGVETIPSDLNQAESLEKVLEGVGAVIHAAAIFDLNTPKERLDLINVVGTENLSWAALRCGVSRFIHISSGDIYGPLQFVPATEDHPLHPINDYAASKAQAEAVILKYGREGGLKPTILRPSMMYGPNSRYIACILFATPAILLGRGIRRIPFFKGGIEFTPVHVEDVARAAAFTIGRDDSIGGIYNVAQPEITKIGSFFQEIFMAIGLTISRTIPLHTGIISAIGRIGLTLPNWMVGGLLNSIIKKFWRKIQEKYDLNRSFDLRFNKEIFSYFIGERAFSTDRLLSMGFRYRYPNAAVGIPPTIRWYVDHKWLPPSS